MISPEKWIILIVLFALSDALAGPLGVILLWNWRENLMVKVAILLYTGIGGSALCYLLGISDAPRVQHRTLWYTFWIISARVVLTTITWWTIIFLARYRLRKDQ